MTDFQKNLDKFDLSQEEREIFSKAIDIFDSKMRNDSDLGVSGATTAITFFVESILKRWYFIEKRWNGSGGMERGGTNAAKYVGHFLPKQEYKDILMIGSGSGLELIATERLGYNVTGITLGDNNSIFSSIFGHKVLVHDVHATLLPNRSFDAIVCCQTIEHMLCPPLFLMECFRLLKIGGKVIIESPKSSLFSSDGITEYDDNTIMWGEMYHIICPTPRQLLSFIHMGGFKDTSFYYLDGEYKYLSRIDEETDCTEGDNYRQYKHSMGSEMDNTDITYLAVASKCSDQHPWMPDHLMYNHDFFYNEDS